MLFKPREAESKKYYSLFLEKQQFAIVYNMELGIVYKMELGICNWELGGFCNSRLINIPVSSPQFLIPNS